MKYAISYYFMSFISSINFIFSYTAIIKFAYK